MKTTTAPSHRVLVAVPAYNEDATIEKIVNRVRQSMPDFDLLVVNDGSRDNTKRILESLGVVTATHLTNLGYARAIQTAIKFALVCDYDTLITLDADGQHHPEQVLELYAESRNHGWDVLIGSRYVGNKNYSESPFGRRVGMQIFSRLVKLASGQRIYDTSSGLKVMKRSVFEPLAQSLFVDFHAEAIVYLIRLGYRVGEHPITAAERTHGQSMYSFLSHLKYPLKTSLLVLLGLIEANLRRRKN